MVSPLVSGVFNWMAKDNVTGWPTSRSPFQRTRSVANVMVPLDAVCEPATYEA